MDPTVAYPLLFVVGSGINTATLTANYTVDTAVADTTSPIFHSLVASGSDRQFILPDPSASLIGLAYVLSNAGTSGGYSWLVRGKTLTTTGTLSSASTIGTLAPGETCYMTCYFDGTYYRWKYQVIGATIATSLGTLTEGLTFAAGITKLLDASATATGQSLIKIGDNLAIALEVKEGSNSYLKFVTTNSAESVVIGQPLQAISAAFTGQVTTTDGVSAGNARIVGGNVHTKQTSTTLTNSNVETTLASHTLPANMIKAGTTVRVRGAVRVTGNAGADTLTLKLRLGGTALVTTTAAAMVANDVAYFDFVISGRAAPSASSSVQASGTATISVAGTHGTKAYVLAPANYATNGALDVDLRGAWSTSSASDIAICETFVVDVSA